MAEMKNVDLGLTCYDELFMSTEERLDARKPKVDKLPLSQIVSFKNHPFKVKEDEELERLKDSIRESGVLVPGLARPTENGYELISGHRRMSACKSLGMDTMPVIIRNLTDEEAVITMVDSNLQREKLLPSEKAFAYKMKMEALSHQGKTSRQLGEKWSVSKLSDSSDDSERQIHRYIRLTNLIPELLDLVDNERIALTPAVELSYLKEAEQIRLFELIESEDRTPSLSQSIRLKNLSQSDQLTEETMLEIMTEEKANQTQKVSFRYDDIKRFFPKDYTPQQIQESVLKMLQREYERKHNRDAR